MADSQDENPIKVGGAVHHLSNYELHDPRILFEFSVQPSQLPAVVEQLKQKGKEASWVVFMFYTPNISAETDDNCPNLQFSIQNGTIGLDWVLLGPRNIVDEERIAEFIQSKGHTAAEMGINDVEYLRVEDGDICGLGSSIIEEFYKMPRDADIGILVSGFTLSIGGRHLH